MVGMSLDPLNALHCIPNPKTFFCHFPSHFLLYTNVQQVNHIAFIYRGIKVYKLYRMRGSFGGDFNLVVWQILSN